MKSSDIPVPSGQNTYGFGQGDGVSIYGNKIVIGNRSAGSDNNGAVMLYTFENDSYQLSKTIEGERAYMNFGSCVRFNKNGSILAMMQKAGYTGHYPDYIGYLYCTKSYSITGDLEVKGNLNVPGTITTNKIKNENNFDIDIEENTISFKLYNREISKITNVGSPYYTSFTQTASNTQHGYSVAISDSDTEPVVVVGQPDYYDNGTAYVYQFNGSQWVNISDADIMKGEIGDNNGSKAGTSVAISGDGTVIAVAAPKYKNSAYGVGEVKSFKRTGSSYDY